MKISSINTNKIPYKNNSVLRFIPQSKGLQKDTLSFCGGLKNNLRMGEKILKDFQEIFPVIHSNSFWETKLAQHNNDPRYQSLIKRSKSVLDGYRDKLIKVRIMTSGLHPSSYDKRMEILAKTIQEKKFANCDECAQLIQWGALNSNIKAYNMCSFLENNITGERVKSSGHVFTLFGFKNNSVIEQPKTWGNNAVIVDAWKKIVLPASEALEIYKEIFRFDPKLEEFIISDYNKISPFRYMEEIKETKSVKNFLTDILDQSNKFSKHA